MKTKGEEWSGREDSNLRPPGPEPGALPDCATPRDVDLDGFPCGSSVRVGLLDRCFDFVSLADSFAWGGRGEGMAGLVGLQVHKQKQIPFGNDNKNGNSKSKGDCKSIGKCKCGDPSRFDCAQGQDDDVFVKGVRGDLNKMERNPSDFLSTSGAKSSAWLAG